VTWLKTDESGHALGDSQWTLTGPDVPTNTTIADCTSAVCPTGTYADQDPRPGYFELLGQHWGDYILVEYKAPAGYERDTTEHPYTINSERWKNDLNGVTNAGTFVNKQKTPPTLPFTGGVSTDAFVIGGSVIMLLALGTGVVIRRRKVDSTY
jgi:LPXTG-motif cell wall-anchored protein